MKYLESALDRMSISWDSKKIEKFHFYRDRILEWNEKVNLTAIKDLKDFEIKHFVDSVACCTHAAFLQAGTVIDVGTGAGFPGVPLAILFPEKQIVLVDSLNKRIKILQEIVRDLGITNVIAIHARAEDLARSKEHRETYDLCVSRAVAELAVLAEYCLPLVRVGGWFAAYKTISAAQEIRIGQKAVCLLGGRLEEKIQSEEVPPETDHQILWIRKEKTTPAKYPRKSGTPTKEPLK